MIGALLLTLVAAAPAGGAAGSPLRALAAALESTQEPEQVRGLLDRLRAARSGALGLPDERLGEAPPAFLTARTLDALLLALDAARTRLPALRPEIDALVSAWDLCAAGDGTKDLVDRSGFVERSSGSLPAAAGAGLLAFEALDEQGLPGKRCTGDAPPPAPPALSGQTLMSAARLPDPPEFQGPTFTVTPGAAGGSPAIVSSSGRGISTRLFASWLLQGRMLLGANATWTPWRSPFFVRAGAGVRLGKDLGSDAGNGAFLNFGAGYDDWRTNTFSFQINHWEPYFPTRGLDARKLLASAAYKLPRLCKATLCLSPVAYLDVPLRWDEEAGYVPVAGGRLTLSWGENLFLLLGAGVTLKGPSRVRWIYAGGHSSWRSSTFSLDYENWGPNVIPAPHFIDNGQITLGFNLGF